jgi:hypothetical protein
MQRIPEGWEIYVADMFDTFAPEKRFDAIVVCNDH